MRGLRIYPADPLRFDAIIEPGDSALAGKALENESKKLTRYFLAALTLPEDDLWVNLSPYEKDRIVPDTLGATEMGHDMLSQDHLLKQVSAALTAPDNTLGKDFWAQVYRESYARFNTTEIPINTFNKVWVMPDRAGVYARDNKAFIMESRLKVLLESDHLASRNETTNTPAEDIGKNIFREILLPALEAEINTGRNFSRLRQIYHSLILAYWYKTNLKASILNKAYADRSKIQGIDLSSKAATDKIYASYLDTFKKGVVNLVQDEYDPWTGATVPRKYFSGGFALKISPVFHEDHSEAVRGLLEQGLGMSPLALLFIRMNPLFSPAKGQRAGPDKAALNIPAPIILARGMTLEKIEGLNADATTLMSNATIEDYDHHLRTISQLLKQTVKTYPPQVRSVIRELLLNLSESNRYFQVNSAVLSSHQSDGTISSWLTLTIPPFEKFSVRGWNKLRQKDALKSIEPLFAETRGFLEYEPVDFGNGLGIKTHLWIDMTPFLPKDEQARSRLDPSAKKEIAFFNAGMDKKTIHDLMAQSTTTRNPAAPAGFEENIQTVKDLISQVPELDDRNFPLIETALVELLDNIGPGLQPFIIHSAIHRAVTPSRQNIFLLEIMIPPVHPADTAHDEWGSLKLNEEIFAQFEINGLAESFSEKDALRQRGAAYGRGKGRSSHGNGLKSIARLMRKSRLRLEYALVPFNETQGIATRWWVDLTPLIKPHVITDRSRIKRDDAALTIAPIIFAKGNDGVSIEALERSSRNITKTHRMQESIFSHLIRIKVLISEMVPHVPPILESTIRELLINMRPESKEFESLTMIREVTRADGTTGYWLDLTLPPIDPVRAKDWKILRNNQKLFARSGPLGLTDTGIFHGQRQRISEFNNWGNGLKKIGELIRTTNVMLRYRLVPLGTSWGIETCCLVDLTPLMSASPTKDLAQHNNLGGIDLTGKNMDVSMGGAKTDFAMIPGMSEEKLKSAAGFVPVVMGMTTVINAADLVKPDL